jgi:hypothetical protein
MALLLAFGVGSTAAAQTQRVHAEGPGAWGADLHLVEEIRIGRLDGAEEYLFGSVSGIAIGRDGAIHVADTQVPAIRAYDARGRFVRNLGGKGSGPGEYQSIGGIRTLPDGRVTIWDPRQGRISVYTAVGAFEASHVVPGGLFADNIFQTDHTGHFHVRTVIGVRTGDGNPETGWIRIAPTGAILDTLRIPREPRPESFVLMTSSGVERPFPTERVTTLSPLGHLISGRNDTYAFDLQISPQRVIRIERPYAPIRLGRDERNEWEAWSRFFEQRIANPSAGNPNPARRASFSIPDMKPAFSELATDSQGRIWVRRYVEAQRRPARDRPAAVQMPQHVWREPPTFDVFESDGRFLGTVTLPWNAVLFEARDNLIWATVRGEFDETYVVRYRMEPRRG